MNLKFLPAQLKAAIDCLNINFLTEIRIRRGQPVIIEYRGEYQYINRCGAGGSAEGALRIYDVDGLLAAAVRDGVYAYAEQMKNAFVTFDGGVRVGIAGQYVTENGRITAVRSVTSLNIRIPHDVKGCAAPVYEVVAKCGLQSALVFSPPGLGKTTLLRDLARKLAAKFNVLVFDERGEISAADCDGDGYDLGERCDVVRGGDKLAAFAGAIRAMKPDVIVTDELYGQRDAEAVKYAADCGIAVCASTHVTDVEQLKDLPFKYYCRLTGIGGEVVIYDKNFDIVRDNSGHDDGGHIAVVR